MSDHREARYPEAVDIDEAMPVRRPDPRPDYDLGGIEPEPERRRRPEADDHRPPALDPDPVLDEATGVLMVTIRHEDLELAIPADVEDWPITATLAFEDGKIINAIKALLSPRDFAKVLAKNYRNKEFGKLYEALAKAGGFDTAGN